jgi:hypothetical protein
MSSVNRAYCVKHANCANYICAHLLLFDLAR